MGRLSVVGLGPGDATLLAPLALAALTRAQAVAGYTTYLKLLDPALLVGKRIIESGMTAEIARVRAALASADTGVETALVCGGDAGVYGLASLAYELAELDGLSGRVEIEVLPGIPALAAAAALLGAPLTHDFACISLSDLLTPWAVIEKRITLATEADFVLVVYNPRSRRRREHLPRALEIMAVVRGPATPVGLVRNAYREGQSVTVTTLAELDVDTVDMLSILVAGNSSTRMVDGKLVTPRGYLDKYAES